MRSRAGFGRLTVLQERPVITLRISRATIFRNLLECVAAVPVPAKVATYASIRYAAAAGGTYVKQGRGLPTGGRKKVRSIYKEVKKKGYFYGSKKVRSTDAGVECGTTRGTPPFL